MNAEIGSIVPYSISIPTRYGMMILNRHDINQTSSLFRTGKAVDHDEIMMLREIVESTYPAPRNIFLDVGACFGTYSLALRHWFKEIYTFEPQRILYNMICGSVALNGIENIHVINAAVGGRDGIIDLPRFDYASPLNFGSIEFGLEQNERLTQSRLPSIETVPIISLRDFIYKNDLKINLIKIDVEGMEMDVIRGAALELATQKPLLFIEWIKSDRREIEEALRDFGYTTIEERGPNLLCSGDAE